MLPSRIIVFGGNEIFFSFSDFLVDFLLFFVIFWCLNIFLAFLALLTLFRAFLAIFMFFFCRSTYKDKAWGFLLLDFPHEIFGILKSKIWLKYAIKMPRSIYHITSSISIKKKKFFFLSLEKRPDPHISQIKNLTSNCERNSFKGLEFSAHS